MTVLAFSFISLPVIESTLEPSGETSRKEKVKEGVCQIAVQCLEKPSSELPVPDP